ncbi:MAG: hypothetical protein GX556_08230 [Fibrobacter sp.]|nr:hypothetical protein [Fibrobacter sp.]
MRKRLLLWLLCLSFSLGAQSYSEDWSIARAILDSLGLTALNVENVTDSLNGRIVSLKLPKKNLVSIPSQIGSLTALKNIDLSNNFISSLPSSICGLTNLQSLKIQNNRLQSLPAGITALKRINYMDLTYNYLCDLPDSVIQWLEKYSYVNPNSNPQFIYSHLSWYTTQLCADAADTLVVREILDTNGLTDVPVSACVMGCANGRITALDFYYTYYINYSLYADKKRIKILPECIGKLDALVSITAQYDSILKLPDSLCLLTNLRVIDIPKSKIRELPENFGNLTRLRKLNLNGNQITDLPP